LPEQTAAAAIYTIVDQFEKGDIDRLKYPKIFQMPEVKKAGDLAALQMSGKPTELLRETKTRMCSA